MDYPDFSLSGQVALVTGASQGIGHDLALALAHAGARVAVAARQVGLLERLCAEIAAEGGEAAAVEMDLRDRGSIEAAVAATVERFGRLDVLVNNAGLGTNHDALDATEAEWDDLFAVNVRGLFFACQSAGRRMVGQRYGRIVNMSSQAGLVGIRRHAAYTSSKAAVIGLTKVLALEWGPYGVTVNCVAPTFIRTPGTAERLDQPEFLADVLQRIPVGRVGSTTDVAGAVLYLASPSAGLVTGSVLTVDGGWTAQ
ncbi:MAG: short-chain dehydrogenase/reductase SDR [Chloroflexi bacterium CSP1-4]|nr:MAG: short-chain dehydrogenase/reductase SDR [Chloroflexi bacterium CSP1-4]